SHAVRFHLYLRAACLAAGAVRQLCRERVSLCRIALVLLRSGLCRAPGLAAETETRRSPTPAGWHRLVDSRSADLRGPAHPHRVQQVATSAGRHSRGGTELAAGAR